MYRVYVLQSETTGRFYIGHSDRDERLLEHNHVQTASTRGKGPWIKVWEEEHPDRSSAVSRELQIKAWKSREAIIELIEGRASR